MYRVQHCQASSLSPVHHQSMTRCAETEYSPGESGAAGAMARCPGWGAPPAPLGVQCIHLSHVDAALLSQRKAAVAICRLPAVPRLDRPLAVSAPRVGYSS
jgi:hypothetical protein